MKILYVDDEQRTLTAFASDHAKDGMSIETCLDARQVVSMLSERDSRSMPDVIVMDLYATKDAFDSAEAAETNQLVDDYVERISVLRNGLQALVSQSKTPAGIDALRDIRRCHRTKAIPVVLRTREGLALVGDQLLRDSIILGAEWMLKGRDPGTERAIISRAFESAKTKRIRLKRDVAMMLGGAILGILGSVIIALFQ